MGAVERRERVRIAERQLVVRRNTPSYSPGVAVLAGEVGEEGIGEDSALYKLHDVERSVGDGIVHAEGVYLRYRHGTVFGVRGEGTVVAVHSVENEVFAVDAVCRRRKEFTNRRAAEDILLRRRFEQVGRVRLPKLRISGITLMLYSLQTASS